MCEPCYMRDWRLENAGRLNRYDAKRWPTRRHYLLVLKYGISYEEATALLEIDQCEICGEVFDKSARQTSGVVDHDHATGKIRGVLCRNCNSGLGMLGDTIERVIEALRYLDTG